MKRVNYVREAPNDGNLNATDQLVLGTLLCKEEAGAVPVNTTTIQEERIMGLFGKKDPCAICGGKVKGLFPWTVGGVHICNDCYGQVYLPNGAFNQMSLDDFKGYMAFREENNLLRQKFQVTHQIDFGWFDTKFLFDSGNRLLCMDKNLAATIFEGSQVQSFVIKEDATPLFEGTPAGLRRHVSSVPERIIAMEPQINQHAMQERMQRNLERMADRLDDDKDDHRPHYHRTFDIPEPFKNFNVEIRFNHPYWRLFTADMSGPTFNNDYPSVDDYLRQYNEKAATMEDLARALMEVAFPGAPDLGSDPIITTTINMAGFNPAATRSAPVAAAPAAGSGDVVAEIQRFKQLMDQGIITEEEFTAKKRQLLGI